MEPVKYRINNKQKLFARTYSEKAIRGDNGALNSTISVTKLH